MKRYATAPFLSTINVAVVAVVAVLIIIGRFIEVPLYWFVLLLTFFFIVELVFIKKNSRMIIFTSSKSGLFTIIDKTGAENKILISEPGFQTKRLMQIPQKVLSARGMTWYFDSKGHDVILEILDIDCFLENMEFLKQLNTDKFEICWTCIEENLCNKV